MVALIFCFLPWVSCTKEGRDDIGSVDRLTQLRRELEDEENQVRARAVTAIGQLHDPALIPLIEKALTDSDPRVRAQAAHALGEIGGSAVLKPLERALEDGRGVVRQEAVEALARLDDPEAIRILENTLLYDRDLSVRLLAAKALSHARGEGAIDVLRSALPASLSEDIYSVSLELTNLLDQHEAGSGRAILLKMLERKEPEVRLHTAGVLALLGEERGVEVLKRLLRHEDVEVRFGALNAVLRLRDPKLIPSLTPLKSDTDERIRNRAAWSIETLSGGKSPEKAPETNPEDLTKKIILAPPM